MFESAGDDRWIVGVNLTVVSLQKVEDLTEEQELMPARRLALQGKTKNVVELGNATKATVLDSRACILAYVMTFENSNRDSFHSLANKLLKKIQRERCRKESFHKSKNKFLIDKLLIQASCSMCLMSAKSL